MTKAFTKDGGLETPDDAQVGGNQVDKLSAFTKDMEIVKTMYEELELYKMLFGEVQDPYGEVDLKLAFRTYKENEDFHQNFGRYVEALRAKLEGSDLRLDDPESKVKE